jgi:putative tricarboxylic transport membrane protein
MEEGAERQPAPSFIHMTDLALSVIILLICGFLFWSTTTFERVPASLAQNVQPTMFPRLLIAVIAVMALFLPFEHVQKRTTEIDLDSTRGEPIRPIAYVTGLVLLGIVLFTPQLGTLLSMIVACAVLPLFWGERRIWIVAVYAVALPLAVALLFEGALEVSFEPGMLGHIFR